MTSPVMRDRILQDEIDLGFVVGSFQNSEIESRLIARHEIMALLSPGHPLATKEYITVEDLARESLVMGSSRNGRLSGVWLSTCSRTPDWS
jgi:LysR family transcriptional regulator, benzoate and cis,cis-muconate-responsive activator of ben and cat genes